MKSKNHSHAPEGVDVSRFTGTYAAFTDAKLVEMVRAGDEQAFESLMARYMPMVTAFLWGKMWERDEIADLSQEIFIRAYTKIGQLRDTSRFNQWLLRIARHAWADFCRNPGTQRKKLHSAIDDEETGIGAALVDSGANPAESAGDRELAALVQLAIGELKERYRVIMYLRLIEEKSNAETAALTGLKENAVRTRFSRGLEALRNSLIKRGLEPF